TGRYGWDAEQLSIGLVTMGQFEILGQSKLGMSKLAADAAKGQKVFQLSDTPTGWEVGDTIIVTKGGNISTVSNGNDVKAIDIISGTTITCTKNLNKNRGDPRVLSPSSNPRSGTREQGRAGAATPWRGLASHPRLPGAPGRVRGTLLPRIDGTAL
ncbi:MAG: hypothetical protein AAF471_06280, partial [Myxococcota bacterium]